MTAAPSTLLDAVACALRACDTAPDGVARPAAILWTDPRAEWRSVVRLMRDRVPELITLGDYQPSELQGPAVWVRCIVDVSLPDSRVPDGRIPIVYLPGVGRQQLRAGEECPWLLQPLIELTFRGAMWLQRSGHDWTVTAFLSSDTALGLDLARDEATREAVMRALPEVASTTVASLRGRRLEARDFDALIASDPDRDLLRWMSATKETREQLGPERWAALRSQCRARLSFDPERDGELIAGERLGTGDGPWATIWERFAEVPQAYPGVPDLLRRSKPPLLIGIDPSRWPDVNDEAESAVRAVLAEIEELPHDEACDAVLRLEAEHRGRREWLWAKIGRSPMATVLQPLATLAAHARTAMGGVTPEDFVGPYIDRGWEADAAALQAIAMSGTADELLLREVVQALLVPWIDDSAAAFQSAIERLALPGRIGQPFVHAEPGGCLLFVDGLRYDLGRRVAERLQSTGHQCVVCHRWAALPTVTATAKPAVSPAAELVTGDSIPDDFAPMLPGGRPAVASELRKAIAAAGYQVMFGDELQCPASGDARAWSEVGEIDSLGHKLGDRLPTALDGEVDRVTDRIRRLLEAGWSSVRVVTDHGWLYAPRGLSKVDLPKHLTESRWSRCAAIKGHSQVEVPTPPWHWKASQRFATAPRAACFNASPCYAHGGLSVQECLIPDLQVTAGAVAGVRASIVALTWRGMRCFVEATASSGSIVADLRLSSPAGRSAAASVKPLDADGCVSLVLEDDRHEDAELVVVLLGTDGVVLAQRRTRTGATT